ncbi:hypothetical protein [Haladaptatus salinisoli]|nr:hypothetical protein [Haladaptatus salinisoli]
MTKGCADVERTREFCEDALRERRDHLRSRGVRVSPSGADENKNIFIFLT